MSRIAILLTLIWFPLLSKAVQTAGNYPRENLDGSVTLAPGLQGSDKLRSCDVFRTDIQYIAQQAICVEYAKCEQLTSGSQLDMTVITNSFYCPTTPDRGCRDWKWQACLTNKDLDEKLIPCLTKNPTHTPAQTGCPSDYKAAVSTKSSP